MEDAQIVNILSSSHSLSESVVFWSIQLKWHWSHEGGAREGQRFKSLKSCVRALLAVEKK
jgi:hypothetical protein